MERNGFLKNGMELRSATEMHINLKTNSGNCFNCGNYICFENKLI